MSKSSPQQAASTTAILSDQLPSTPLWRSYAVLTKPEITFLVTISAFAGYLVGSGESIGFVRLAATLIGIGLSSAGAATLNHAREWPLDLAMDRTRNRPIPQKIISPKQARIFGYALSAAGLGLLCPVVNPLTALLAGLTIILYVYVYTPLKTRTTWNTLVGTLPGALPALGGYTAATGRIEVAALPLFAVLIFWQMPHFLSLAWIYRDDYSKGGFKMLPSVEEDGKWTGRQCIFFAIATAAASLSLLAVTELTLVYPIGVSLAGIYFCVAAFRFGLNRNKQTAQKLFKASIWYVPILLLLMLFEHFA